mgnify:CR=1 FL=1
MTAYVIFTLEEMLDPAEMAEYSAKVPASRVGHAIKPIVFLGDFEMLEGDPISSVAVFEFPDVAAARAWYHSPEYQTAAAHRLKGARCRVFIVEGVA